jgi:hypothetical protein
LILISKEKRERPVNEVSSSPIIIPDKRKLDENDNTTEGEPSQGEAKKLETSPKGLGKPWGLSVVGNGGNTPPTNEALGEPLPLSWRISPPSAYSEPVEPENPMCSSQRELERYGKLNADILQKESLENNDDMMMIPIYRHTSV